MKIIVDAMGGDNAPFEIVKGAIRAPEELGVDVMLVGRGEEILKCLHTLGHNSLPKGVDILDAGSVVEMEDDPVKVIRTKKDSSMVRGLTVLSEGYGDAFVSAGSTGALLTGATLIVKRVKGIRRAAMAPILPSKDGGNVMIIDCGATAECTSEYLMQYAYMGSYYMESVMGIKNPRIGLLNNGTESTKGTALQIETYGLLMAAKEKGDLNFIGNVEARGVMLGDCDVVVCDGFSGNILLKTVEGTAKFFMSEIKKALTATTKSKVGALLVKSEIYKIKDLMDAERVGGTMLLGISKPVIKAHGSSNSGAIFGAIRQAKQIAESDVVGNLIRNRERMIPQEDN